MAYRLLNDGDIEGFHAYRAILPKPIKRSASEIEDDAFEQIYSLRKSSRLAEFQERNWTPSPISEFVGITLDDLPIAPLGTSNPIMMYYLDFPVKRKLDWSTDENGNPKRRNLKDAGSLIAGFVQTRGELAETPCNWCSQGKGVWERCVIGSDVQDGKPMSEACANCRFSRRPDCTFRTSYDREESLETDSVADYGAQAYQSPFLTPPSRNQRRAPFLDLRLQSRRVVELPDDNTLNTALETETKTSLRAPSRHDGKVIPFPLDPKSINDLPLLKQASRDLAAHLAVVDKRIRQLEEEEKKRKKAGNPWDLL
ncbi:hypothetical protein ASPVEDRAFT_80948 [Aspergillus versicolor CBS 583.65]|uniref:Uncharacterized protein n=1 Tax=Aspergillus versicolor CBS 583.65 TaxID=1036611 RepID=A0A1L9PCS6_ASPVE|nr:uncharacterized protein ASPVEDRAFT_80948 [Aspergillus versicolor CBS 583.65]OJI99337.1 hypothetical protein ASPVEDRAFT_80948 [Aspergillus versicolor CBS 583.65]